MKERSAEAEAMIAAIERVVWEALCDNGNRSSASTSSSTQKSEQAQDAYEGEEDKQTETDRIRNSDTVGEQLAMVLGAAPGSGGVGGALALREYGKEEVTGGLWKDHSSQHDQKEELQLQEEHEDRSENGLFKPFVYGSDLFTKTGSGQT